MNDILYYTIRMLAIIYRNRNIFILDKYKYK